VVLWKSALVPIARLSLAVVFSLPAYRYTAGDLLDDSRAVVS
jgi:hypothetical protein